MPSPQKERLLGLGVVVFLLAVFFAAIVVGAAIVVEHLPLYPHVTNDHEEKSP